jgi:hypothetical protein
MSNHEVMIGFRWIIATARGNNDLMAILVGGFHRSLAPQGVTPPYGLVNFQSGSDLTTANGVRIFSTPLYQIKAVGPASMTEQLEQAASINDDLFGERKSGTTVDGYVSASNRESPVQYDEMVNGKLWTNIGGMYRTLIEQNRSI